MLSVSVSDVAPDGTVSRLTGGWQVLSQRALDKKRTRYLDGKVLQPYHPFTRASKKPLASRPGRAGRRRGLPDRAPRSRRATGCGSRVQAFDVPHLLPTVPDLPGR